MLGCFNADAARFALKSFEGLRILGQFLGKEL